MRLTVKHYQAACRVYEANDAALNRVLYDVCRRYPDHQQRDGIKAKLWLIGRSLATGIERQINTTGTQGSALTQPGEHLWRNRRHVDACLRSLREVREPLTPDKLRVIMAAHGRLAEIVQPRLRRRSSPRSFIAKYLHFHVPAVPIYDALAASALRKLYPWRRTFLVCDIPAHADPLYARFVLRFWQCYQALRAQRQKVSVRLIDQVLLALAKEDAER